MFRILVLDDMDARHQVIVRRYPDAERVHVWNFGEAVTALTTGRFDLMLLDHDLGEEHTGQHVAEQIAKLRRDWHPADVVIHSHNPSGAERMRDILERVGIRARLEPFASAAIEGNGSSSPAPIVAVEELERRKKDG